MNNVLRGLMDGLHQIRSAYDQKEQQVATQNQQQQTQQQMGPPAPATTLPQNEGPFQQGMQNSGPNPSVQIGKVKLQGAPKPATKTTIGKVKLKGAPTPEMEIPGVTVPSRPDSPMDPRNITGPYDEKPQESRTEYMLRQGHGHPSDAIESSIVQPGDFVGSYVGGLAGRATGGRVGGALARLMEQKVTPKIVEQLAEKASTKDALGSILRRELMRTPGEAQTAVLKRVGLDKPIDLASSKVKEIVKHAEWAHMLEDAAAAKAKHAVESEAVTGAGKGVRGGDTKVLELLKSLHSENK